MLIKPKRASRRYSDRKSGFDNAGDVMKLLFTAHTLAAEIDVMGVLSQKATGVPLTFTFGAISEMPTPAKKHNTIALRPI